MFQIIKILHDEPTRFIKKILYSYSGVRRILLAFFGKCSAQISLTGLILISASFAKHFYQLRQSVILVQRSRTQKRGETSIDFMSGSITGFLKCTLSKSFFDKGILENLILFMTKAAAQPNFNNSQVWTSENSVELIELPSNNKVSLVYVSSGSNTGSIRDDPYWTFRKNILELIELSSLNKVSLV